MRRSNYSKKLEWKLFIARSEIIETTIRSTDGIIMMFAQDFIQILSGVLRGKILKK
jgi:hypothetical protein